MIRPSKLVCLLASFSALSLSAIFAQSAEPAGTPGKVSRELWWNMSSANDLEYAWRQDAFYQAADVQTEISILEVPPTSGDQYVQRLRGYIIAPVTGEYYFWASGDNDFAFWLGTGESKFSKNKLIHRTWFTSHRAWGDHRGQASEPVMLVAGQRYYVEAQNKEGAGGDHVSVSWSYSGGNGLTNWSQDPNSVATQSTVEEGRTADKAIDGDISGHNNEDSFTKTSDQSGSWWQVDLGQSRLIDRVELFNREQKTNRLSNFRVSILDAAGAVVLTKDFYATSSNARANELWETGGVQGSVVKVELLGVGRSGEQILSLAEVKVLGRSNTSDAYQTREVVPGSVLESYAGSLNDLDNDELPDDIEVQYGFDPSSYQTGAYAPYADADLDGLSNADELMQNTDPFSAELFAGQLTKERWTGIVKYDVLELINSDKFFGPPEDRENISATKFIDILNYTGARLRGYVTAPVSGNYRFWVSATNGGQLWLSEDNTKYSKKKIAEMGPSVGTGHGIPSNAANKWDVFSSQMSKEIYLEAGQQYFLEMLTQQGHGSGKHVSVAWAVPNQAREELPVTVVSSYGGSLEDSDDDYLPDAWETQHGLSILDNGLIDRAREGENGDFDNDGLNNRAEYLAGTNPSNPDSDGDGISDKDELQTYGTDPNQTDAPSGTLVDTLNLVDYSSEDSFWSQGRDGLISNTFRGSIAWNFDVPSSGFWSLNINTLLRGETLYPNERIPAQVFIDGVLVWDNDIVFGLNREASLRVLTPHLAVGQHEIKVVNNNILARRSLSFKSIELLIPDGADSDGDGQPDWVSNELAEYNYLSSYSSTSRTSPAFIEGGGRIRQGVSVDGLQVNYGLDSNHWYYNIDLNESQPNNFTVDFESGVTSTGTITWEDTNIFNNEALTIRQGDTLKLLAQPGSVVSGQSVTLNFSETDWTRLAGVTASQSSTALGSSADLAIDGDTNPENGVSFTNDLPGSWWQVDLGAMRSIDRVQLWNRESDHHNELSNYRISVLDNSGNVVTSKDFHKPYGHSGTNEIWVLNSAVQGQIVKVELLGLNRAGNYVLPLAECNVYGPQVVNLTSDAEYITHTFNSSGLQTVVANHSNGDVATLTVNVKKASFSETPKDLLSNSVANLSLDSLRVDHDLYFDGGKSLDVITQNLNGSSVDLLVASKLNGSVNIVARLYEGGPILNVRPLNLVTVSDGLQNDLVGNELSENFPGYRLLRSPLVATNFPEGGQIKVTIFRAGVIFEDGSKVKWINVDDMVNGVYYLEFLFPDGLSGGYCHHLDIYDRDGNYLGRR